MLRNCCFFSCYFTINRVQEIHIFSNSCTVNMIFFPQCNFYTANLYVPLNGMLFTRVIMLISHLLRYKVYTKSFFIQMFKHIDHTCPTNQQI